MSYKENSDYININLKRTATEDELLVLNRFWNVILPYRYIKGGGKKIKKLFSKDMFFDKNLEKVKIKKHFINIKSHSSIDNQNFGVCFKKSLSTGAKPESEMISTVQNSDCKEIGKYFHKCGTPVTAVDINKSDIRYLTEFTFNLAKQIKKSKISNGLNIIVVGSNTTANEDTDTVKNAFLQKKLTDLTIDAFQKKVITAVQSCEYGIFTALVKLIRKRKWGIFVNIDNLHKTQHDLSAGECLISETPERLIFGVLNRKLVDFLQIVDKYELDFSIIGKIDKSKSIKVISKNNQVIHLNKKLILNPLPKISLPNDEDYDKNYVYGDNITEENLDSIFNDISFKSKKAFYKCFDGIVGNKTSFLSKDNGISELWYPQIKYFISQAIHSDNLQIKYNPYSAGQNIVCEAVRKIIAIGHKPLAIYVNCNYNLSEINSIKKISELRNGIYDAAKKLKIKVINIVLSQSEENNLIVLAIGKKKKRERLFIQYFENAQKIYMIGKPDNLPATSTYQKILEDNIYPYPDKVNFKFEKRLLKCIRKLQKCNLVSAIIPIERFGIVGALVKSLSAKKLGFKCDRHDFNLNYMFNEIQSRFLVSTTKDIEPILKKHKIPFIMLGKTKTADYIEFDGIKIPCEDFYSKYFCF